MVRVRSYSVVLAGLTMLAVGGAHLAAVNQVSLVRYGFRGAEYLEHLQREYALQLTAGLSWLDWLVHFPDHLALLDGQYPPLMHLLATGWARLFGDSIPRVIHMNLVYLLGMALGTGWLASELSHQQGVSPATEGMGAIDPPPRGLSPMATGIMLVLLTPALFASARRYYYDVPLAAWCVLAAAALVASRRTLLWLLLGAICTAAACLTKWQAGLYLAPVWIGVILSAVGAPRGPRWGTRLFGLLTAALAVPVLCWPIIRRSDILGTWMQHQLPALAIALGLRDFQRHGSLDDALGQAGGMPMTGGMPVAGGTLARLLFYWDGLVGSSLGPFLSVGLAAAILLGVRRWRILVLGLWSLSPVLFLAARVPIEDERFLLPMIPLALAAIAAAWSLSAHQRLAQGLAGLVCVLGLLQLAAVHGAIAAHWGPRPPVELRGWNRLGEGTASPWEVYLAVASAACLPTLPPSAVVIDPEFRTPDADVHAWRWALTRGCPGVEVVDSLPPGGCVARLIQKTPSSGRGEARPSTAMGSKARARAFSIPGGRPALVWVLPPQEATCRQKSATEAPGP